MRRRLRLGDRGAAAAEFAVALPALVLVVVLGVGAMSAGTRQVRLHDAVADALVKHVAAVRGSLVLLKEGPETLPLPVQLRDVYVKQSLYLAEILERHLVDGAGHGSHDLAGSAVGILVVGQAEGQEAVPQISLEAVGGRQLHQLAGETVRELRLRLR